MRPAGASKIHRLKTARHLAGAALLAALAACSAESPAPAPTPPPRQRHARTRPAPIEHVLEGKVVGVADGDTIRVLDAGQHEYRVRLEGIDTPEKAQAFGDAARDLTSRLTFGKQAQVKVLGTDDFGRTLGRVRVGALDVNLELVRQGLAWRYKYSKDAAFAEAEAKARAARIGLWKDRDPVPPWDWRRQHPR